MKDLTEPHSLGAAVKHSVEIHRPLGALIMVVGFAANVSVVRGRVFATYVVRGDDVLAKRVDLAAHLDLTFTTEITGWEAEACVNYAKTKGLL